MNQTHLIFIIVICLIVFLLCKKKTRHQRNIKKAKQIRIKINTIENNGAKINYLRKIDPFVFEELLLNAFKDKGYKIIRNKKYTGDGGIDGKIIVNGFLFLIQAKRYSSAINPAHIKEFNSVIKKVKAKGGYFIHTGRTGNKSYSNMENTNIKIISGEILLNLLSDNKEFILN